MTEADARKPRTQKPPPSPDGFPPSPLLAYHDSRFLESREARPLRILAEYLHPLAELERQGVHDTVVFFGSARQTEDGPLGRYYKAARTLARLVTEWSLRTRPPALQCLICSGGGGGMMEAANRGASEAGGRTIGLNIGLPHEQHPNRWVTPELSFEFHYFFMRKLWFAHTARAIVAFPGGFGTMDELFEMLTLSQTGKLDRPVQVLLFGSKYWREIVNFQALVEHGVISAEDLELFQFVDDPSEALEHLQAVIPDEADCESLGFAHSATCVRASGDPQPGTSSVRNETATGSGDPS